MRKSSRLKSVASFFKLSEDTEIYNYFRRHYLHYFPNLPSRTTFVRQSANLRQAKMLCQSSIVQIADQQRDQIQSIDTLPLPVCTYTRGGLRNKRFPTVAQFGHSPPKRWTIKASNSDCEFSELE
jgi:hypothetical protein